MMRTSVLLACVAYLVGGQGENDILSDIQAEIVELTKTTKESRRDANVESYEKIFLRLGAVGMTALGRNMLYASTQTVLQGDDDEEEDQSRKRRRIERENVNIIETWLDDEELEATGRSQFVPQILGEPLFYTPASYWLQVVGRSLTGAGFLAGNVIGLKTLELGCSLRDWSGLLSEYKSLYSPTVSPLPAPVLRFQLRKFLRRAKTELSCLTGTGRLDLLLSQLGLVLGDQIDNRGPDGGVITDDMLENSMQDIYRSIQTVTTSIKADWLTSSSVTTTILLSKLTGFSLITWGRNIGDWPTDVPLADVTTGYKLGILGRALLYTLFVLDDFRKLADYSAPTCGEEDVYSVLDKYSALVYTQPGTPTTLNNKLKIEEFSFELKSSVSCLTSTPAQFLSLDSLTSSQDARRLEDRVQDLVDMVRITVG